MGTSKKDNSTPNRRYPPFWEKATPIVLALIVVIIVVLIFVSIAVALGIFPNAG